MKALQGGNGNAQSNPESWDKCYIEEYWERAKQIVGGNLDVSVAAWCSQRGMQVLIVVPDACFHTQRNTPQAALEDLQREFQLDRRRNFHLIS